MTTRTRLPNRRPCETFTFTLANLDYVASVGYGPDGAPMEVFLTAGRAGTHLAVATQEAAILVSLALQHGCPLETLRSCALRSENGKAEGSIGHIIDAIYARLEAKPLEPVP